MKRSGFKVRPAADPQPRIEAYGRSFGLCIICGDPARDPHHVLPVRLFPKLANTAENLVWLCRADHERHENAFRRLRKDELPECVLKLVHRKGPEAQAFFDRTYR